VTDCIGRRMVNQVLRGSPAGRHEATQGLWQEVFGMWPSRDKFGT
jgi:hypothetical protein